MSLRLGAAFTRPNSRSARPPQSTGEAAELAAEFWFQTHGWTMHRTQPATRRVWLGGKPVIVPDGKKSVGIFDFTGFCPITVSLAGLSYAFHEFRAVEVKEAAGGSMVASRLSRDQRAWGAGLPAGTAFVLILWTDRRLLTLHPFKPKGSYLFEEGTR